MCINFRELLRIWNINMHILPYIARYGGRYDRRI